MRLQKLSMSFVCAIHHLFHQSSRLPFYISFLISEMVVLVLAAFRLRLDHGLLLRMFRADWRAADQSSPSSLSPHLAHSTRSTFFQPLQAILDMNSISSFYSLIDIDPNFDPLFNLNLEPFFLSFFSFTKFQRGFLLLSDI